MSENYSNEIKKRRQQKLSIIVPVYNEKPLIPAVWDMLKKAQI